VVESTRPASLFPQLKLVKAQLGSIDITNQLQVVTPKQGHAASLFPQLKPVEAQPGSGDITNQPQDVTPKRGHAANLFPQLLRPVGAQPGSLKS